MATEDKPKIPLLASLALHLHDAIPVTGGDTVVLDDGHRREVLSTVAFTCASAQNKSR
jgi:hypothetical protein